MNTLTKNRILEAGDEYRDNGTWKAIPPKDLGLQIMFTKYSEVRRPSEEPLKTISPDSEKLMQGTPAAIVTDKAEAKQVPASGVSPAGGESLPTIISKRAHCAAIPKVPLPKVVPWTLSMPVANGVLEIPFPAGSPPTQWIGRNGTFYAKGVHLQVIEHLMEEDNIIQIRPKGARGLAKNALIEFPASIIPQVVDWLIRMQPATTKE